MSDGLLPLFPLEMVLLPHAVAPLHIFEERYKEMIGECLRLESEFGLVQVKKRGLLRTGCTALVDKVLERYEDGRLDILVRGMRRFHVLRVDTERSFLRGEVEFFGDEPSEEAPAPAVARRALAAYLEYAAAAGLKEEPPSLEAPGFSFRLAEASPDLDFRQFLLDLTSEYERLRFTTEHFERFAARRKLENAMKRTARHNGHGRHLGALSD